MSNIRVAFEILPKNVPTPDGYSKSSGHPAWSTFADIESQDSVRIAFTYAALNGLDVKAADIHNTYLQAPASEKHYIICGSEFWIENIDKVALIRRALYGGKAI